MNLADVIERWIGRVEIVLAGAEEDLRAGEQALARGDGFEARACARRLLERAPASPIGLALLADACDEARLEAELLLTLEELARRAPARAEVWVRLGQARRASGAASDEVRDAWLRALAVAEAGSVARLDALLALADLDLAEQEGSRAELWLARIAVDSPAVAVRRAEARLLRGNAAGARTLLEAITFAPIDGRAALTLGRARSELGEAEAFAPLLRAFVLDEPGASEALSGALARLPTDSTLRTRIRSVVDAKGEQNLARWSAAFAQAEGARKAARLALRAAVRSGERGAAQALLEASIEDHDLDGLKGALEAQPSDEGTLAATGRALVVAASLADPGAILAAVMNVGHPRALSWAEVLMRSAVARWIGTGDAASDWTPALARLGDHARALGDTEAAAALARLSAERSNPVLMAVVGEFNAGKSTFINALVGQPVTPTGILPTTAVPHYLRWAPDSLAVAKILLLPPGAPRERIVAPGDLKATLAQIDPKDVERVEIRMPVSTLARVEILDTPGFNADVAGHDAAARSALDEADIAAWLVDATQAMKQSERLVLGEIARRRLPVQVLVNKTDRLTRDDVVRVLAGVDAALTASGLSSWRPPCAFSSKQALAGQQGDTAVLRDSGWSAVHALVDEGLVADSDRLKELSTRRRASVLVSRLVGGYLAREEGERAAARALGDRARLAAAEATRIERSLDDVVGALASSLGEPARQWARELSMVFVGKDLRSAESFGKDPMMERYRVDSALSTLAPVLLRELVLLAPLALRPAVEREPLAAAVRGMVRSAAAAVSVGDGDGGPLLAAVGGAAVMALVEQLLALSSLPAAPPAPSAAALRELGVFSAALGPSPLTPTAPGPAP